MGEVQNFKCPCCDARLTFDGKSGEMSCEYCGAHFTMEQIKALEDARKEKEQGGTNQMNWDAKDQEMLESGENGFKGYGCPTCGAELVADEKTAATECPYCGNPAIIPKSFEGIYKPNLVIPFAIDKQKAVGTLKEFTKGKKLLPKSFTEGNRIEEITGLYVPFWLYSAHAKGSVDFEGVKSKTWEDQDFRYEQKDYYDITRSGEMDFVRIPVDAATRMDDALMDSIEPYDMTKAVSYDAAYFSGYLADRYDVKEKEAQPRANERILNTFRNTMRNAVGEYTEVKQKAENINLTSAKAEYAMLPVWMMTTKYEGNSYTFGINGQSGKMVGSLPVDKGLYRKYLCLAALISMAVMQVLVYFMGGHGFTVQGELIALAVSVLIGFLYAGSLKSAMNNVSIKTAAANYVRDNSIRMGRSQDLFMYSKKNRTAKPRQQEAQNKG